MRCVLIMRVLVLRQILQTNLTLPDHTHLDAPVFSDQVDELLALLLVGVIQPAASVNNVILLQHTQSRSIRRRMRKYEDLPSILSLVRLHEVLKPVNLLLVNGDLMRGEFRITEKSGAHTHKKRLVSNLTAELRSFLVVCAEVNLEVLLVGFKLVKSLKVVVSTDNVVGDAHGAEKFSSHFVAHGGTGEKLTVGFRIVVTVFGLAQISERDNGDISVLCLGLFEDWQEVALTSLIIFHFTRINVQISQYSNYEFISGIKVSGRSEGSAAGRGGECGGVADEENGSYQSHVD